MCHGNVKTDLHAFASYMESKQYGSGFLRVSERPTGCRAPRVIQRRYIIGTGETSALPPEAKHRVHGGAGF